VKKLNHTAVFFVFFSVFLFFFYPQFKCYSFEINKKKNNKKFNSGNSQKTSVKSEIFFSNLPLKLLGTIINKNTKKSFCLIQLNSKKEYKIFYTGDTILNTAKISGIKKNKIIINNLKNNRKEFLAFVKKTQVFDTPAFKNKIKTEKRQPGQNNTITFSRDKIKYYINNIQEIINSAYASPYYEDNHIKGFKITNIKKDSIVEKAGIKNGDIIIEANGNKINSLQKAIELFNSIASINRINLLIKRNNRNLTLEYIIKD